VIKEINRLTALVQTSKWRWKWVRLADKRLNKNYLKPQLLHLTG